MAPAEATTWTAKLPADRPAGPSAFYRAGLWKLGWAAARSLPLAAGLAVGALAGALYGRLQRERRRIVLENLLPLCGGDRVAAGRAARRLFRHFGRKLVDLLRFEAGAPVDTRFVALTDWERFEGAQRTGRGTLLLTPHLGNWEIGAPLLIRRGVPLLVVTQAEPGDELTELRRRARARWGVETLVIGQDTFAFVDLIHRLQAGATVAMLVDRPPAASGCEVPFCGRPFRASLAPAELARATGCALLGVSIVAQDGGYAAAVLPEFAYDRAALGQRAARIALTARILAAFEPVIRRHADQWFHFVPVWPTAGAGRDPS